MIENFSLLSPEEQTQFAADFVKKLNDQKVFSDDADLDVYLEDTEADEMTGSLWINVGFNDLALDRAAYWTCDDHSDAERMPSDYEFVNSDVDDAKSAFKTQAAELDGYVIEVKDPELIDYDTEEVASVDDVTDEDAGIGSYEYWGDIGYDSRPYCAVNGAITVNCNIGAWLVVTAK